MKIRYLLSLLTVLLLVSCSLGNTSENPSPDDPAPPVDNNNEAQPDLSGGEGSIPITTVGNLGLPLGQALQVDLTDLQLYVEQGYILANYYETTYDGFLYAAIHLQPPAIPPEEESLLPVFLVYQAKDNQIFSIGEKLAYPTIQIDAAGWRDVSGDGIPDLPVLFSTGNASWKANTWRIFSMNGEGVPIDLLKDTFTATTAPIDILDPDGDKTVEVKITNSAWLGWGGLCPSCSPQAYYIYDWHPDRRQYENFSARFPNLYQADIAAYTERLQGTYNQPLDVQTALGPAVSILLAYDYIGQREQGWERFLQATNSANWPGSSPEALAQLETLRNILNQSYQTNQPFSPTPGTTEG